MSWDGRSGKTLWDVQAHQSLFSIFTGGTGEYAVTISRSFDDHDGPKIWNTKTGVMISHIEALQGFGIVPDPVFDPKGRWIQFSGPPKIGETDGQVLLWNTKSHRMTASASHPGSVGNATVDRFGRLVARAEGAGVALWDGPDLIRLQHLADGEARPYALGFSPNGERIAVTVPEAATRIDRVPVFDQSLMDAGQRIAGRTLTSEERARYFLSDQ